MRRFEEVDNEFAARFRAAGYELQETLGLGRESGIFGDIIGGLTSIVSQGAKAWCAQNPLLVGGAKIIFGAAKDAADQIGDWYEENKVIINNVATIALETLAIAGAVLAIGACALTPVGWVALGVGLAVSASNIIDSGVKIYNYTQNGTEKGFNLIEKGFQAVLGEEVGSNVYTGVSIATGLYNVGKGAVTVADQAKKFYTSVKSVNKAKDLISLGSELGKAEDIVTGVNKLDNINDAVAGVNKFDKVEDTVTGIKKLDDVDEVVDSVRQTQKNIIDSVDNGDVTLETNIRKGNYGEMKMDDYFESGAFDDVKYERISTDRVINLNASTHQGIDGVYFNSGPPPKYVVAEAKYGSSKLSTLSDGTPQMSDDWITSGKTQPRLDASVGKDVADDILIEGYDRVLTKVDNNGNISTYLLDADGQIMK